MSQTEEKVIGGKEFSTLVPPPPPPGLGANKVSAGDLTSTLFSGAMLLAALVFAWKKRDRVLDALGIKRGPRIPASLKPKLKADTLKGKGAPKFMAVPNQAMSQADEDGQDGEEEWNDDEENDEEDYGEEDYADEFGGEEADGENGEEEEEDVFYGDEDGEEDAAADDDYDEEAGGPMAACKEDAGTGAAHGFPHYAAFRNPRGRGRGRGRGRDADLESSATLDFGAGPRDEDAESDVIGPDDSVSNIGHRPCVLRQARKLSETSGCLTSMPTAAADDSISMIWTRRNAPQQAVPESSPVLQLGQLDSGHSRDLGETLKQREGLESAAPKARNKVEAACPDPEPRAGRRMKASKRLPKQPSPTPKRRAKSLREQEQEQQEEDEKDEEEGGADELGQNDGNALAPLEDGNESALTFEERLPEPFEARLAPRRGSREVVKQHCAHDAESAVTFADEDEANAADAMCTEQQDSESAVTFTAPNHGGLCLSQPQTTSAMPGQSRGRGSRGAPKGSGARSKPTARAPKEPTDLRDHVAISMEDEEAPPSSEAGGGDDVFTMVALARAPPRQGRLAGGGKIENGRWVPAVDQEPAGNIRRI